MLRKHNNRTVLTIGCLLMLMLFPASALADDSDEKGKIKWDTDRIIEGGSEEEQRRTETELNEDYPELFSDETRATLKTAQRENEESINRLRDDLFTKEFEAEVTHEETDEEIFTSDYEAPKASGSHDEDTGETSSWLNNFLFIGLAGLGVLLLGGIFMMFRKLSN